MLEIRDLSKSYPGGVTALRRVTLDAPPGMFGLLGPNGAGKTTLMKVLVTLLVPDSGSVCLDGLDVVRDPHAARRALGYLPQEFGFYPTFTAEQTLDYFARLKGVADRRARSTLVGTLLERVNLAAERRRRVGAFSGGMRQRLGIAQALIGRPRLLVVDEPTAGLDPEERARFHEILADIARESAAVVLLSTHILSDVAALCERLAILRRGEIVASCATRDMLAGLDGTVWEAELARDAAAAAAARLVVVSSQAVGERVRLRVVSKGERPGEEFAPAIPTFEDFYFGAVNARDDAR